MSSPPAQPVRHSITPAKQGAKRHYGIHPYFTKRAWNVVQRYIEHFSSPGEVVLDPFGGSGVTATEALVLRRRAVYVDINPWACFLARQAAIAPVDLRRLQDAFDEVEQGCRRFIEELWQTSNEKLEDRPVRDWYPKDVPLPSNADVRWVEELFTPRMLHGLARLRAGIDGIEDAASRDLLQVAFSATLARINRTFLSTEGRRESRGGSALFSIYRYKVAERPVELPLWEQFAKRFARVLQAKRETNQLIGDYYDDGDTAIFRQGSATHLLGWLEPDSVDYIYTDPPYGAHIAYLDLSTMWAAWLRLGISSKDRVEEIIEGGEMQKSREVYQHLLCQALAQMSGVLKSDGWLSIVFAHRDTTYWESLVEACNAAGLTYVNTVVQPVGVVWSMHKKKNPLRVLSGELVLNFRKTSRVRGRRTTHFDGDASCTVRQCCEKEIIRQVGATTEDLHHAVIPKLLESGLLSEFSRQYGDITPLLERHFAFDSKAGRWHLAAGERLVARVRVQELVRYHVARFLLLQEKADQAPTEAEVYRHVQAAIGNGQAMSRAAVRRSLRDVGHSADKRHWRLRGKNGQQEFLFSESAETSRRAAPEGT